MKGLVEDFFLTFALHQPLFSSSPRERTIYIVLLRINFSGCEMVCSLTKNVTVLLT